MGHWALMHGAQDPSSSFATQRIAAQHEALQTLVDLRDQDGRHEDTSFNNV